MKCAILAAECDGIGGNPDRMCTICRVDEIAKLRALVEKLHQESEEDFVKTEEQLKNKDDQIELLQKLVEVAKEVRDGIVKSGRVEIGSVSFMDLDTTLYRLSEKHELSKTVCIECHWDMESELAQGFASASRSLQWTNSGYICSRCFKA